MHEHKQRLLVKLQGSRKETVKSKIRELRFVVKLWNPEKQAKAFDLYSGDNENTAVTFHIILFIRSLFQIYLVTVHTEMEGMLAKDSSTGIILTIWLKEMII